MQLGHCGEKEFCSRRSDKDTFYTANAPESLVPDEKNATWELNKDGRRNANAIEASCVENEVASRKLDSASMYHELATVINEKEGLDDHSTRKHSISLTLPHRIVWGKCTATRNLSSVSMCRELATAISTKREWPKNHKGAMCAASAKKPFVQGRSGQCECTWTPIVR